MDGDDGAAAVQPSGTACWKCASSGRRRRSRRGSDHAIRSSCDRAGSSIASTPAGTSSGSRVTAAKRRSGAAAGSSRSRFVTYVSSPVRARPSTSASRGSREPPRRRAAVARATSGHDGDAPRLRPERARDAVADRVDVGRVDVGRVVAGELGHRAAGARHDRAAAGERLGDRDAEALVERGVDEAARAAVERARAPRRRPRRAARRSPAARRCPSPARRRRAARRRPRPRSAPGSCAARASRPRARSRPRRAARRA